MARVRAHCYCVLTSRTACLLCGLGVKRAAPLQPPMAPIIGAAGARGIKTRRLPLDSASRGQAERCDSRGRAVSGCLLKWIASSVGSISTIALLLQLTVTRTCTRCFEDARYPPRHSMPAALLLLMAAPRTPSPRKIGAPLGLPLETSAAGDTGTRVSARRRGQPQGLGGAGPLVLGPSRRTSPAAAFGAAECKTWEGRRCSESAQTHPIRR